MKLMFRSLAVELIRALCLALLLIMAMPVPVDAGGTPLSTRRIASGVSRPVLVTAPQGDFERLFIVQQQGTIRIYDMTNAQLISTPFMDINSIVGGGTSDRTSEDVGAGISSQLRHQWFLLRLLHQQWLRYHCGSLLRFNIQSKHRQYGECADRSDPESALYQP